MILQGKPGKEIGMKKLTAFLMSILLVLGVCACGNDADGTNTPSGQATSTPRPTTSPGVSGGQNSGEDDGADELTGNPESGDSENVGDDAQKNQGAAGKTLVVYFSASGNTRTVAEYIAAATDGDLFELLPVNPYSSADLNWSDDDSRVVYEHEHEEAQEVELEEVSVAGWESYDTVFIGYPIWWHIAAWPVNGFVKANDFTGKTVIPFCTSSSSGLGESGELLKEAAGTGNWLSGERFSSYVSEEAVKEWVDGLGLGNEVAQNADTPIVYFTSDISPEGLMAVYEALGWVPEGRVAVKLSTGEPPASNYLDPQLIKDLVQSVDASIVECNTAYGGSRTETAMHMQVAKDHGFTEIADVDILDADGSMELAVVGGNRLTGNLVGSHFADYDSYIILSHFKGHAMAGFGGAIKNISIGLGSREGKCLIHTAGKSRTSPWGGDQTGFTESMAEAGKSVSDYLGEGARIVYINVLNNISIDCDCDGNPAKPDIHDIGIVASLDPVAVDQACIDLAFAAEGSETLQARVNSRDGLHTLEHAEKIGLGSRTYQLVDVDG